MAIEETEVRAALGIAEDADPVAAIANMRAEITSLNETIAADPKKAASAEFGDMRRSLTEANRKVLTLQADFNNQIAVINEERRQERAKARVGELMARGKVTKANEETALDLALNLTPEKFDAIIATMQHVDLSERGIASGDDMQAFEPTPTEIEIAKNMGTDTNAKGWRLGVMRDKAKAKGLTLPAEVA